ncbi:23S rRNA (pseudouridine(1915)-N(3))-methyltransferase RlmH [Methanomicrobium antiquum]|uniref:Putative ribosomal RNA large subunit methyltransferase H n=1 Tax=Methanomicrobium antiquum TaxID=487686 RepID=A0AAF0JLW6_9EURY|nr:23S rRNA (pseudouridine(1915)-N(3))-methyltransferase RlmH [Methanomicrobium antiquum]MDD3977037.1 23S rRNA (pseudouridine(1915)-N(3))-methyltransferase RlmH [Methanomicrobium sp.]WFN35846.1 23S rRNA (pseudouridine(1915)-N(3))-methyltransferase RlmH [Methanomicrobium antiquum]
MVTAVRIIAIGKIKEKYLHEGILEYSKRLKQYINLEITEISDESIPENPSLNLQKKILDKEGEKVISSLKTGDYLILLDLKGEMTDSESLALKLKDLELSGISRIVFVVGGSLGVSENLIKRADFRLCLSKLTFTHQIARFILIEQIYRAYNINRGGKYHR